MMMVNLRYCQLNDCPFKDRIYVPPLLKNNSKLLIVGESPGINEEIAKKPFVGKAGNLLLNLINMFLPNTEISITNSVCCRIDKNVDSIKTINTVIKSCRNNLLKVIEIVKPEIIMGLGAIAAKQLLGLKTNISGLRGRFIDSEEFKCKVFVTWHPAYLLRNMHSNFPYIPMERMSFAERIYLKDWEHLKEYIEKGYSFENTTEHEYIEAKSTKDLEPYIDAKIIAVDIETSNVDLFKNTTSILSIGLCNQEGKATVVTDSELLKEATKIICSKDKIKILAGRPFDEHAIFLKMKSKMEGIKIDILTLAHILDENYIINLENVADKYAKGMSNIKDVIGDYRKHMEDCPRDILIKYQASDVDATWRSFLSMKKDIERENGLKRYYYYFIIPIQNMFAEISLNGVKINKDKLVENEQKLMKLRDSYIQTAISFLPESIKKKYADNLDINRNIISIDFLFTAKEGLRLKPVFVTPKTKQPQITEEHLSYFSHPYIDALLKKKNVDKIINTYISRLWKSIKADGRIYPQTLLTRTVTGRTVMLNPEIQTYPKRGEYATLIREVIEADDGWVFGSRDLSQSELRIMGWLSKDENILNALKNKEDLHERTAKIIMNTDKIDSAARHSAKAINFGFIYGMQASTFQRYAKSEYGMEFSLEECKTFRDRFFSKPDGYWKVDLYHKYITSEVLTKGYVISPLGRKRRLFGAFSSDKKIQEEAIRQAINMGIQSFSSDLGLLGMYLFYEEIKKRGMQHKIKPLWFIHDEVIFMSTEDCIDEAHSILKDCMENGTKEYIKKYWKIEVGYPIETEGKVGKNWGNMCKLHTTETKKGV